MQMKHAALLVTLAFGLSGCASILEGTKQEITVNTIPPGAKCTMQRNGADIATLMENPDTRVYERTKYDIVAVCRKDGCDEARYPLKSGTSGGTFGNIILGGGIGWAIDSAAGADNEYPARVDIPLNCPPPVATYDPEATPVKAKPRKR